tara:strand:- start:1097 stop:1813 length:717 start_codon:yes stop_codon:yes gene_type:complete
MAKHSMSSEKASLVKRRGHTEELTFNTIFGGKKLTSLNLSGDSEDCFVENSKYKEIIQKDLKYYEDNLSVSLKSGNTWQFHLGRIDEISTLEFIKENVTKEIDTKGKEYTKVVYSKSFEDQLTILKSEHFWNKYFGKKGNLLCFNDKKGTYTFFEMKRVVGVIINQFKWRLLETGRIKGDCIIQNKEKKGVITIEYRAESHKQSLVLGSSGGTGNSANGYRLFLLLKENIAFSEIALN